MVTKLTFRKVFYAVLLGNFVYHLLSSMAAYAIVFYMVQHGAK